MKKLANRADEERMIHKTIFHSKFRFEATKLLTMKYSGKAISQIIPPLLPLASDFVVVAKCI